MSNLLHWHSELKTVKNTKTGKTRYYILKCETWVRVTKKDYISREDSSGASDSYLTVIKGNLVHNSKVIYGTYKTKI